MAVVVANKEENIVLQNASINSLPVMARVQSAALGTSNIFIKG